MGVMWGKCPVFFPPKTRGLRALGVPACFQPRLSMGSKESWPRIVGALLTPWPSWWMTGVRVPRLPACNVQVSESPSSYTTIPRGHRAQGASFDRLVARSGCQEIAWKLRPFPGFIHPAVWTSQVTERAHLKALAQILRHAV